MPLLAALVLLPMGKQAGLVPNMLHLCFGITGLIVLILLTIRRLRDADRLMIALFALFPFRLWVELATFQVGPVRVALLDVGHVIRMIPIAVALTVSSGRKSL